MCPSYEPNFRNRNIIVPLTLFSGIHPDEGYFNASVQRNIFFFQNAHFSGCVYFLLNYSADCVPTRPPATVQWLPSCSRLGRCYSSRERACGDIRGLPPPLDISCFLVYCSAERAYTWFQKLVKNYTGNAELCSTTRLQSMHQAYPPIRGYFRDIGDASLPELIS